MVSFHPLADTVLALQQLEAWWCFLGGGGGIHYVNVMVVVVGLYHPLQHVSVTFFFSPIGAEAVYIYLLSSKLHCLVVVDVC